MFRVVVGFDVGVRDAAAVMFGDDSMSLGDLTVLFTLPVRHRQVVQDAKERPHDEGEGAQQGEDEGPHGSTLGGGRWGHKRSPARSGSEHAHQARLKVPRRGLSTRT